VWLETSAGADQVLLLTANAGLSRLARRHETPGAALAPQGPGVDAAAPIIALTFPEIAN
jgi:hypothetical protein